MLQELTWIVRVVSARRLPERSTTTLQTSKRRWIDERRQTPASRPGTRHSCACEAETRSLHVRWLHRRAQRSNHLCDHNSRCLQRSPSCDPLCLLQAISLVNFCKRSCSCFRAVYKRLLTVLKGRSRASAISLN